MNLTKERVINLNEYINEGTNNMKEHTEPNFRLSGIMEETYSTQEIIDLLTDVEDVVILVRYKDEDKSKLIKLKREHLGIDIVN